MTSVPDPKTYSSVEAWASDLVAYLRRQEDAAGQFNAPSPVLLSHKIGSGNLGQERASVPGILMYDPVRKVPVYSVDGRWQELASYLPIFGGVSLSAPVAGADLGVAWQNLDFFDTNYLPARDVTLHLDGTLSFSKLGLYNLDLFLTFAHNELNQGRSTNIRVFNDTTNTSVSQTAVSTARNVLFTTVSISILLNVTEAGIGNVYRFQIGNGDNYSSVVWRAARLSIQGAYNQ